jgi:PAS domain S-box-containing protein
MIKTPMQEAAYPGEGDKVMYQCRKEIARIWKSLHKNGSCEGITVSEQVQNSWKRCKQLNIDPYKLRCDQLLNRVEFQARIDRNKVLVEQAAASMTDLYRFTEGSGFVFVLADCDGYILLSIGDRDAQEFVSASNFIEGTKWSEDVMGTNAIGSVLIERKPVQVFAYEHYCAGSFLTTCSASPIFDANQNLIGVLDITGPYGLANHHTLGMAVSTARAIERQMVLFDSYQKSAMDSMYKSIIMESVSDGVLTLDQELRVIHANGLACKYLGFKDNEAKGKNLEELLPPGNQNFLSRITENKQLWNEPILIRTVREPAKVAVSSTPLVESDGKVLGKVVTIQAMNQYRRMVEQAMGARATIGFEQIIGKSQSLASAISRARAAASSDSNVLLLGESGVGKEMFAQAIHKASMRNHEPFFAINCAALPRELVSSELFGYEEGAFTGAKRGGNPGKFELADQGTLFLDEIGEMPLDIQAILLRILEEGLIIRLGGRELTPVNVRIIAASNKNLIEEVRKGKFRLDLYYRLGVIIIDIPPLRSRKEDIPELVEHFIKVLARKMGKDVNRIDDRALDKLLSYNWPGNVRELSNVIERAINLTQGPVLNLGTLEPELMQEYEDPFGPWGQTIPMDAMEEVMIRTYLKRYHGNKTRVAQELGIARSSLYRKLEKYSLS